MTTATTTPAIVKTVAFIGQKEEAHWAKSGRPNYVEEKYLTETKDSILALLSDTLLDFPEIKFTCGYRLGYQTELDDPLRESYFNYVVTIEQPFPSLENLDPEIFIYDLADGLDQNEFFLESLDVSDNL
jgi:hypothetical protein